MRHFLTTLLICVFCLSANTLAAQENENETLVLIDTDMGKIKVKLFNETPLHRENFLKHVSENHYNNMIFHRVIKQFMIQGGGEKINQTPEDSTKLAEKTNYTIPAEFVYPHYFHKRGMLCAARTGDADNPEKASSSTQFYIVTGKHYTEMELNKMETEKNITLTPEQKQAYMLDGGTPHLDGNYTIFGEVVSGMKVVDKIQFVPTNENDRPVKPIKIKSMTIVKK